MSEPRRRGLEILQQCDDLPAHEAQRLMLAATGWSPEQLYGGRKPDDQQLERFGALLARRRSGVPLQYVEGTCEFGPLTLRCDDRALIPRPETEQLWELAQEQCVAPPAVVVDVGTGSGCLALACKQGWPAAEVYATEVSDRALSLAVENVVLTGLDVVLLRGSVLGPMPQRLRGTVDVIVSNPPYLAASELPQLPAEVRDYEPAGALVAGETGLEVLEQIAKAALDWLRPGGVVLCEISEFRGADTAAIFRDLDGEVRQDLAARDRFVVGRRRTA